MTLRLEETDPLLIEAQEEGRERQRLLLSFVDPAPITKEALEALGFRGGNVWPNGFKYLTLEIGGTVATVSEPVDGEEEWVVGGERIPHFLMPEHLGDVHRLLERLGRGMEAGRGQ